MKIDRHNYEEFFLLYIDNELTVDQKKQVEAFVSAHPELEEEFVMLQQSRLVADDSIVFDGKESLMKELSEVNMANYEEWLLLYVDNELTSEQRSLVEKFCAAHPRVKDELALFQQTKLEPQEIVFADKASLYKKEEKVRVISMSWWRIAVAAILILAAGFGTFRMINNNKIKVNDTASETKGVPAVNNSNQPGQKKDVDVARTQEQAQPVNEGDNKLAVREDQNKKDKQKEKETVLPKKNKIEDNQIAKNDEQPNNKQKEDAIASNNTSQPNNTTTEIPNTATSGTVEAGIASGLQQTINNAGVTKPADKTLDSEEAMTKTRFDETASNDENKKLRGFFRKAARFSERTTKVNPANDDNRVLIGAMAVSLK